MPRPGKDFDVERGARIRAARLAPLSRDGKLTLQEIAAQLGKHYVTIQNWEKGRVIADSDLRAIAAVTGYDFEWLKNGTGEDKSRRGERALAAERILQIRKSSKMSRDLFASVLSVSPRTVQNWEKGLSSPKASQAESILSLDMTGRDFAEDAGRYRERTLDSKFWLRLEGLIGSMSDDEYRDFVDAFEGVLLQFRGGAVTGLREKYDLLESIAEKFITNA